MTYVTVRARGVVEGWKGNQHDESSFLKVFSLVRPPPAHPHHFQANDFQSMPAHTCGVLSELQRNTLAIILALPMPILDVKL